MSSNHFIRQTGAMSTGFNRTVNVAEYAGAGEQLMSASYDVTEARKIEIAKRVKRAKTAIDKLANVPYGSAKIDQ